MVEWSKPTDGWVLHAACTVPAIKAGSGDIGFAYLQNPNIEFPLVRDLTFTIDNDNVLVNNRKVSIIHQWERVPEWKKLFEERFGE